MRALRAFPLALGLGTDVCRISRVLAILRGPRRDRFVRRILAPEEVAAAAARLPGPRAVSDAALWDAAVFVAGRFAAKEAAFKAHALHRRSLGWHDIVIERRPGAGAGLGGPPVARIKAGGGELEDESALVSISHDGDYATAVCIAHNGGGAG